MTITLSFITVVALEGKDFGLYIYDYASYKIVGFHEEVVKFCSKRYAS